MSRTATETTLLFSRVVVALDDGHEPSAVQRAAELARQLRAELHGVLAQDPRLADLATFEALREFRLLERAWSETSGLRLAADLEQRAGVLRQVFRDAAAAAGVAAGFEVVRAPIAEAISAVATATDIIVVTLPSARDGHPTEVFARVQAIVQQTPAAVLIIPPAGAERARGGPRPGPAPTAEAALASEIAAQLAGSAIVVEHDVARALDIVARGAPVLVPNAAHLGKGAAPA